MILNNFYVYSNVEKTREYTDIEPAIKFFEIISNLNKDSYTAIGINFQVLGRVFPSSIDLINCFNGELGICQDYKKCDFPIEVIQEVEKLISKIKSFN